ncbi:MAG: xanthine dehydrogenase family protein molybdopterin-binding subunit [Burkholderiales bacterium]|nr:xanthine dehydrogenase family protein molybdopterin-binding subunit [Burkholderiales bacterium]
MTHSASTHSPFTRRDFLRAQAATALSIAIPLPVLGQAAPTPAAAPASPPAPAVRLPSAFLRIGADDGISFILPTCEMGQGTHTGQAQILAEELGADWTRIAIEMPKQPAPAYRLPFGQMRSVGSFGIRFWHDPLRRAAAQARMMLIEVGASRLQVPTDSLDTIDGHVVHAASGRRVAFGELAAAAQALPVPAQPVLRPANQRTLTGKPVTRLDTPAKVRGQAVYAIDVELPQMLYGAVRLAPVFAADVAEIDDSSVRNMPGIEAVVRVPRGAVVVARSWWQAQQAAQRLAIRFTSTPHDALNSAQISERLRAGLDARDVPLSVQRGDLPAAFATAARVVEADYEVPMLAHVCMEPIVGTARSSPEKLELWLGTQGHDTVRMACERAGGLRADQIEINTTYLGGGFGRKTHAEIAIQAMFASRAVGGRPVKVLWQRADDIQQGQYRQPMMARMRAALDAQGRITALRARVSGPQMGRAYGVNPDQYAQANGLLRNVDPFSLAGLVDMRYQIPNVEVDHAVVDVPIPLCPWRSIANSFTGFFLESFLNECAAAVGQDALAFRRNHLQGQTRMLAVLDRVAESARWGQPLPAGRHRGLAVVDSYGSTVAEVVELRMQDGKPRVEQVFVAIDCGRAINPGQVRQQMHGSVADALGAALRGRVSIGEGRALQSNFGDYPLLRMAESPRVQTSIVEIGSPLGGVGEPGVPPLAPALVAALRSATGRTVRNLPLSEQGLA